MGSTHGKVLFLFLFQGRNRSSASSRAVTGDLRTALTGRSIHTCIHRTSLTTVGYQGATKATHIRAHWGSTWRSTVVEAVQREAVPARVRPQATRATAATRTALQQDPSACLQLEAVRRVRVPLRLTTITTITIMPITLPLPIRPLPSTNNTIPYPTSSRRPGRQTCQSGMFAKVPRGCLRLPVTNIRQSIIWTTLTLWIIWIHTWCTITIITQELRLPIEICPPRRQPPRFCPGGCDDDVIGTFNGVNLY